MSSHYGTGSSSLTYARPVAVFGWEGKGGWLRQGPYGQLDLKCSQWALQERVAECHTRPSPVGQSPCWSTVPWHVTPQYSVYLSGHLLRIILDSVKTWDGPENWMQNFQLAFSRREDGRPSSQAWGSPKHQLIHFIVLFILHYLCRGVLAGWKLRVLRFQPPEC